MMEFGFLRNRLRMQGFIELGGQRMSKAISLKCLRCGKTYGVPETDMAIIGYTKYSYCEDCLREGLRLLDAKDEMEELRQPFYVIDTPMGQIQTYKGRPMAFKKRIVAEWQIQETERLMRKNGFAGWCGYMFIRPMTLERCGKPKNHFKWMDKTVGEMDDEN